MSRLTVDQEQLTEDAAVVDDDVILEQVELNDDAGGNVVSTTHKSSAQSRIHGSKSLMTNPLFPPGRNSHGAGSKPPVTRSVRRSAAAGRCPAIFLRLGFSSNRSRCEGPPAIKRKMTCFAVAT